MCAHRRLFTGRSFDDDRPRTFLSCWDDRYADHEGPLDGGQCVRGDRRRSHVRREWRPGARDETAQDREADCTPVAFRRRAPPSAPLRSTETRSWRVPTAEVDILRGQTADVRLVDGPLSQAKAACSQWWPRQSDCRRTGYTENAVPGSSQLADWAALLGRNEGADPNYSGAVNSAAWQAGPPFSVAGAIASPFLCFWAGEFWPKDSMKPEWFGGSIRPICCSNW